MHLDEHRELTASDDISQEQELKMQVKTELLDQNRPDVM